MVENPSCPGTTNTVVNSHFVRYYSESRYLRKARLRHSALTLAATRVMPSGDLPLPHPPQVLPAKHDRLPLAEPVERRRPHLLRGEVPQAEREQEIDRGRAAQTHIAQLRPIPVTPRIVSWGLGSFVNTLHGEVCQEDRTMS